jgi:hypothetical protein
MTPFKIATLIYGFENSGNVVFRDQKTLGYCFINTGNCPVYINNLLLPPSGVFKTFEYSCVDMTSYRMNFKTEAANVQLDCTKNNSELTVLIYEKA